ncbi:hypothetical protein BCR33DRAFT_761293 [Rhizoclosmatium globosum]|uniref:50S ribosomal protein L9, chloroplastic n=1 Tax=Rhizoclosmatium globosum TaxID=329046 RepID=A0A1Y2D336_9FUNG|nr:hypothetical protein BCR33DRAFT_761293 [Rhizoclosmatium globosum]|eukprot:ORY52965.1 hypothetical protein BCR33DRAFT_761293 [Rhizoclosmatium globosum]
MPFRKADIHVLLYESIPGLGQKGEIVQTSLGLARNYLVPFKLGYYAPRLKGKAILPKTWEPRDDLGKNAIQTVLPAFFNPTTISSASIANAPKSKKTAENQDAASALTSLGVLEFKRPLIDPKGRRTFGSVSPEDIVTLLRTQHKISVEKGDVVVDGGRIKEIGDHTITVRSPTSSQVTVQIKVVAE